MESVSLLRFATAGSVDDGKSTLIGRLLFDTQNVYDDHIAALRMASSQNSDAQNLGTEELPLELLTDGLRAEREQGITIDVAYRYFSTLKRNFILADAPGHVQYTRNMATGASTARLALLVVDAKKGISSQTKRHAFILSLLGVPRFVVSINKMDLVNYSRERFEELCDEFKEFAAKLDVKELRFIPISALRGDNVVHRSKDMEWYSGETILEYLENVYIGGDLNLVDFRFPVQYVIRGDSTFRGYAGQISSGTIRVGDEVLVLPSLTKSRIQSIIYPKQASLGSEVDEASAPHSVTLTIEDEIDISRGDMIVRVSNVPSIKTEFEAMLVWMDDEPMDLSQSYLTLQAGRQTKLFIDDIPYKVDINTLHRIDGGPLSLNEIGRVSFTASQPLFIDTYKQNRATGSFVIIEPHSHRTVAAGMIIDRKSGETQKFKKTKIAKTADRSLHGNQRLVTLPKRELKSGYRAITIWITGLPSSGKSTIALGLENSLFNQDYQVYCLDGDNLRFGLNSDLGFSATDRAENIRRASETAKLFNDAGIISICAFVSPYVADREQARQIIGLDRFCEVYVCTPLQECEERDPHGLYRRARTGEIGQFTGISAPYEPPENPDIAINTQGLNLANGISLIEQLVKHKMK